MERYVTEELMYKGHRIRIISDDSAGNPREEWENASHMICWHSRYYLGDMEKFGGKYMPQSKNYDEPIDLIYELAGINRDDYEDMPITELANLIEQRGTIVQKLYLYDHSGLSISSSSFIGRAQHAEWDSGCVGFQYMTKQDIINTYGDDSPESYEKAWKLMEGEVETYDDYLRGNVWGWVVDDYEDSCWGYYGSMGIQEAITEAKSSIDYTIDKKIKKHLQQLKQWIKSKVPVIYRKPMQLI